jgi:hypothetical protein
MKMCRGDILRLMNKFSEYGWPQILKKAQGTVP